ncbi:MAG: DUF4382 domain-containing protein [Lacibacter sp.]
MKQHVVAAALLLLITIVLGACTKNENPQARLSIYLTDDPARYEAVNIDVQKVLVTYQNDGPNNWKELNIQPGIYNLLDFRNGMDLLLGTTELPAGRINQIRLVLGPQNTVVERGVTHILETPSAQQSGLKLNVQVELTEGIDYKLWIDFDAGRSVVKAGNSGKYLLKPVIKTFTQARGGSIAGTVLPAAAQAWVYALRGTDTVASALPESTNGRFLMRGIDAGTYAVAIDAPAGYRDTTLQNITVTNGQVTNVGTITLQQ